MDIIKKTTEFKKIDMLRVFIEFLWILGIIAAPFILILIGMALFNNSLTGKLNIQIHGMFIEKFTEMSRYIIIIPMIAYLISIYCLYLFRRILKHLKKQELYHDFVVSKMNTIGLLLILIAIINRIPVSIYKKVDDSKYSFEIGYNSFFTMLCLGLFFMVLSEIFKIAKMQKEENDLTV